jgi:hypothetical protein
MKDPEFVKRAEEVVMENEPLPSRQIAGIAGYKGERPGRALGRSKSLFYMGNGHSGIWYLEHQVQEARNNYYKILEGVEKRKEERRHQVIYIPPNPSIHSFLTPFKTDKDTYTAKQFLEIVGGNLSNVRRHLSNLAKDRILIVEGRPKKYRRNPEHADICGDAAEEIFGNWFNSDKQSSVH